MRHRSHNRRLVGVEHLARQPWFDACCWPECDQESVDESVPLCLRHHLAAWRTFEKMALWPLEDIRRQIAEGKYDGETPPVERPSVLDAPGTVYFIRLGNRVKIGYTRNLRERLGNLPYDEVLGTVAGTRVDEKRCHHAFRHLRVTREWFRAEQELLAFIADVLKQHAEPQLDSA